jgi:hypothetical protein
LAAGACAWLWPSLPRLPAALGGAALKLHRPCCSCNERHWAPLGRLAAARLVQHTRSRCLPDTEGLHSPCPQQAGLTVVASGSDLTSGLGGGRALCWLNKFWLLCLLDSSIVCCVQRCCSWGQPRQLACSNCCAGTCPWKCVLRPLSSAASGRERQNGFDSRVA